MKEHRTSVFYTHLARARSTKRDRGEVSRGEWELPTAKALFWQPASKENKHKRKLKELSRGVPEFSD